MGFYNFWEVAHLNLNFDFRCIFIDFFGFYKCYLSLSIIIRYEGTLFGWSFAGPNFCL